MLSTLRISKGKLGHGEGGESATREGSMPHAASSTNADSRATYEQAREDHWDRVARQMDTWTGWGRTYHHRLAAVYRFLVAPGLRVLEIGCGHGDLLAALEPAVGVGVDFSQEMIERARRRHPQLRFVRADAHAIALDQKFDVIILSDLVNDLWDVQAVFESLKHVATQRTRIILNLHSRLWEIPLGAAAKLGLKTATMYQNWLTVPDVVNLLTLADMDVIRCWEEILCPLPIPLVAQSCNRYLAKLWPFKLFALTNFIVARLRPQPRSSTTKPLVSVIVPARNEAGNIAQIFERTPAMGRGTELVFVEGHSKDDTYAVIEQQIAAHPEWRCKLFRQTGTGKGDAVQLGFANASGEMLMILDADLTVPPEDLPRFYEALCAGTGEFVNGVRLVYPLEKEAMRFFNLVANKFFSLAFSWLLGQSIKDTLCGTKVCWQADYDLIAANRSYFGNFDPFGDFDLLFGAAKLGLKIVDMPIRYRERTYGTTNIQRWTHGWLLLRMVRFAAGRIKFN
jgi:ubiquinone/menaquinone biosynthesis C-methylase UbiE